MTRPKKDPWATTPNTRRKRPMVMITISPDGLAELDAQRGDKSRGKYVEAMLAARKKKR